METKNAKAFGNHAADKLLEQLTIKRRSVTPHDVEIDILYCGVCHSDLHQVRNEWQNTLYPCVPGHEIVGKVISVGDHVSKFGVGDLVAVGVMVDSCRECERCKSIAMRFLRLLTTAQINIWVGTHLVVIQIVSS